MAVAVPEGWIVRGDLPLTSALEASVDELAHFDEDLLMVIAPFDGASLDVGWFPAARRDGNFVCRMVLDDEWERPIEWLITPSVTTVRHWVESSIARWEAQRGTPLRLSYFAQPSWR